MTIDHWRGMLSVENTTGVVDEISDAHLDEIIQVLAKCYENNSYLTAMVLASAKSEEAWLSFSKGLYVGAVLSARFSEIGAIERMASK